jgi:Pyridine nucleotide-disulphide oxidoreductase
MNRLAGLETNRANQIVVSGTLQTLQDEKIFALGDCAALTSEGAWRPLPPTAQVATQQAEYLARHLPEWIRQNRPFPSFKFRNFGSLVPLSDYDAFDTLGRFDFLPGVLFGGDSPSSVTRCCTGVSAGAARLSHSNAALDGTVDQQTGQTEHSARLTGIIAEVEPYSRSEWLDGLAGCGNTDDRGRRTSGSKRYGVEATDLRNDARRRYVH